jgi:hypothetical protein
MGPTCHLNHDLTKTDNNQQLELVNVESLQKSFRYLMKGNIARQAEYFQNLMTAVRSDMLSPSPIFLFNTSVSYLKDRAFG